MRKLAGGATDIMSAPQENHPIDDCPEKQPPIFDGSFGGALKKWVFLRGALYSRRYNLIYAELTGRNSNNIAFQ